MSELTITDRGQVTFRRDVLAHLGLRPGGKIELEKQPDGVVTLRAARPASDIEGFVGLLAGRSTRVATLEEIDEAAAEGWSGRN